MARPQPVEASPEGSAVCIEHQRRLVERRRCPHCAELQPAVTWLSGGHCRRCGETQVLLASEDHARTLLASLDRDARVTRVVAYGGVFVANLLVGWAPMLSTLVTALGMIGANLWLVRRPTAWLPVQHRMLVRLLVRAWFVVMLALSVEANVIAAPLIALLGLGIGVSTGAAVLVTVLYVEGALLLVRRRVRRALVRPDGDWAWLVIPVGLGMVVILVFLALVPALRLTSGVTVGGP